MRQRRNPPATPDPLGAYGVLMDAAFEAGMLDGPPAIFDHPERPDGGPPRLVTAYHRINAARASWYLEQVKPEKSNMWRTLVTEVFAGWRPGWERKHDAYTSGRSHWLAVFRGEYGRWSSMGHLATRENPSTEPKLSDCPVLKTKHWTEEDVRVAMDWCLERGLAEPWLDEDGNLVYLPQHIRAALLRDLRPEDFGIRVVWEEDEDADWSWLEQPEFADEAREDHVQLCARVETAGPSDDRWQHEPVSLCGIDFLRTGDAGEGFAYAFQLVGDATRPLIHVYGGGTSGTFRGDPYQLEVSRELIDEFGALDPEPPPEQRALAEYNEHLGKLVRVRRIDGYRGEDTDTYNCSNDRVIVRVEPTREDDILRWMDDEHLDPVWSVTIVERGQLPADLRSCWIYGTTQHSSGRREPGDRSDVIEVIEEDE